MLGCVIHGVIRTLVGAANKLVEVGEVIMLDVDGIQRGRA